MRILNKNKKAVSDMVSYVLLIVIALSLAVGVYSFMKFYIPKDKETCSEDVSLYIEDYKCYLDTNPNPRKIIELTIKNKGLFNITGFVIKGSENYTDLPIIMMKTVDFGSEEVTPGRYDFAEHLKAGRTITTKFDYTNQTKIERINIQPFAVSSTTRTLLCERIVDIKIEGCS